MTCALASFRNNIPLHRKLHTSRKRQMLGSAEIYAIHNGQIDFISYRVSWISRRLNLRERQKPELPLYVSLELGSPLPFRFTLRCSKFQLKLILWQKRFAALARQFQHRWKIAIAEWSPLAAEDIIALCVDCVFFCEFKYDSCGIKKKNKTLCWIWVVLFKYSAKFVHN